MHGDTTYDIRHVTSNLRSFVGKIYSEQNEPERPGHGPRVARANRAGRSRPVVPGEDARHSDVHRKAGSGGASGGVSERAEG